MRGIIALGKVIPTKQLEFILIAIFYNSYWGVFWIDASCVENVESGFASIGQEVGKGANFAAGMHWLWKRRERWLLVFDNADDPDMDISQYFPVNGCGHILITTRNPSVIEFSTAGQIRFRGMDPEEAISLLLKSASSKEEKESPDQSRRGSPQRIVSELGYLALAITQAGTTIRRKIYTLEKYLNLYLGHRKVMMSNPRIASADEANIITTSEIPLERIIKRDSTEQRDAVNLLRVFAFIHFDNIPEEILKRSWSAIDSQTLEGNQFYLLQPTHGEETQVRLRMALRVLYDYSIIDHEAKKFSCSLHPVVHAWARDRLCELDQRHWLSRTMELLALCISPNMEISGIKFRRLLLPHIDSCLRALRLQQPDFPESASRASNLEKFALVYDENGLWSTARTLQVKVKDFRLKRFGKRHLETIKAQRNLGETLWNLFEIRPAIMTQLEVLKALFGRDKCPWVKKTITRG